MMIIMKLQSEKPVEKLINTGQNNRLYQNKRKSLMKDITKCLIFLGSPKDLQKKICDGIIVYKDITKCLLILGSPKDFE